MHLVSRLIALRNATSGSSAAARPLSRVRCFRGIYSSAFDAEGNWPAILEVDGVCDVLRNNGTPSPVPDAVVPKSNACQELGLFDHTRAPNPFPPGSRVMLDDDGIFSDLCAVVRRVRSNDRCDVLLRWLGREMMVNVPMATVAYMIRLLTGERMRPSPLQC